MINFNLFKTLLIGLLFFSSAGVYSQMSYEEFHARYSPHYETILPNADLVKNVNKMEVSTAANQVTNSTNDAYDGDEDSELSISAVLTSCKRSHIANILEEMEPADAVRTLKLMKSSWIKELVYFLDMETYHEIAPALFLELFIPQPVGPFGPVLSKWSPAYAGAFYDASYSTMNGYNEVIDGYGDGTEVKKLKGFGLVGGFYTGVKDYKYRLLDITYQNRTGKTKYESLTATNSKFNSNTLAINFLKGSTGSEKFMWAHGWGIQANMTTIKTENASSFSKVGGGINGGINYNAQIFINPIKSIPVMLGVKAYAQFNLPGIDFNPLYDTLFNTGSPSQNDSYKSGIATYGLQFQALYRFGEEYVPKVYKDFNSELSENMDPHINTTYAELTPRISADGKTLYFIRGDHPMNHNGSLSSQDIWVGDMSNGLENAKALHLENPFNLKTNNSIVGISPDGTSMVIKGRFGKDGDYLGNGFSMIQKTASGWSQPKELEVDGYADMTKGDYIGGHWSTDGKHLILSFSESSTDNKQSLYESHLLPDGTWSRPANLGNVVNITGKGSHSPFLASDGKTLYFSSNRDGGLGSYDIWMTQRQDDTWKNWSEPINLGEEINSDKWDAYYTLDAQGKYAYMVSSKNSKGGSSDIVRIKLKEEIQPDPVVLVKGIVLDQKTNKPVSARISYNGIDDGKNYGVANSDPETGAYTIVLPYGVNYEFTASASNYIGISDNLDLTTVGEYKEIEKDLFLVPIEVGAVVRLNNIFFETGKTELKSSSYAELDRVVDFLNENKNVTIEISGHTDNVGNKATNQTLSQKRASAVTEYLLSKGIDKSRLTSKGYGVEKPVADNSTEQGRTLNRRVEFIILSNK